MAVSLAIPGYIPAEPSLLIALAMIAFAFVDDGPRDALDPQSNRWRSVVGVSIGGVWSV